MDGDDKMILFDALDGGLCETVVGNGKDEGGVLVPKAQTVVEDVDALDGA